MGRDGGGNVASKFRVTAPPVNARVEGRSRGTPDRLWGGANIPQENLKGPPESRTQNSKKFRIPRTPANRVGKTRGTLAQTPNSQRPENSCNDFARIHSSMTRRSPGVSPLSRHEGAAGLWEVLRAADPRKNGAQSAASPMANRGARFALCAVGESAGWADGR